jgi:MFS family permease
MTSSAFSLYRLQDTFLSPIVGYAFDRLGPRKLIFFGTTLAGLGFLLFSQIQSFPAFIISVLVMAAGFSWGIGSIAMSTVANWFIRRRTTALGLVMAGAGLGGLIVAVVASLIEAFGWRTTAQIAAGLLIGFGWPLAFFIRHRPEDTGLLPDGDAPVVQDGNAEKRDVVEASYAASRAVRTRTFWLLAGASGLSMVAQAAVMTHAIPHLASSGHTATVAASIVAAMTLFSIVGRIGFGWIGDRVSKRHLLAALYAFQVAGLAVFSSAVETWQIVLFLALYAPSYGGAIPLRPSIQAEFFGRQSFGAIQGVVFAVSAAGGIFGPVFAGWVFDTQGTYRVAFLALAAINALAIPASLMLPDTLRRGAIGTSA